MRKFDEAGLFSFFLQHFEKLGVNLTPENIYMEEDFELKKHTECSNLNKSQQIRMGVIYTYIDFT